VTERETFRLAPPVIFWWVWLAFVALNALDYAVQGLPSARFGAVVAAILLLVTGLACTLALRPRVYVSDDGITVLNPYRTHFVPWRLITAVGTGEWVEIHHAPAAPAAPAAADAADVTASSAGSETLRCWALYVSSRARRQIARGPQRARDPLTRGLPGLIGLGRRGRGRDSGGAGWDAGGGTAAGNAAARLPDEARYLASLPPAKAMAVRLDTRADRERARADASSSGRASRDSSCAGGANLLRATAAWSWPALAAVVIPALLLLAVAVS
jgi:Bacterial PH domain